MKILLKVKYLLVFISLLFIGGCIYFYNTKHINPQVSPGIIYAYNIYDSQESFLSDSELIIRGNVVKSMTEEINIAPDNVDPMVIEYKVVSVVITDVVKGNVNIGDTINVKYPAKDEVDMNNVLDNLINIDSDCLLFLKSYDEFNSNMPYSLVNPKQSIVKFNTDKNSYSDEDLFNLFYDIPKENLIDYLKDNVK